MGGPNHLNDLYGNSIKILIFNSIENNEGIGSPFDQKLIKDIILHLFHMELNGWLNSNVNNVEYI